MNYFTIEVYKKDKRISNKSKSVLRGKNKIGLRFIESKDYEGVSREELEVICQADYPLSGKFVVQIYDTYIERKNMMSGEMYKERYDTPSFCSPSSESYWCM